MGLFSSSMVTPPNTNWSHAVRLMATSAKADRRSENVIVFIMIISFLHRYLGNKAIVIAVGGKHTHQRFRGSLGVVAAHIGAKLLLIGLISVGYRTKTDGLKIGRASCRERV